MKYLYALFANSYNIAVQPDENSARLAINITTFLTVLCWIFLILFLLSRFSSSLRTKFEDTLGDYVYVLGFLVPANAMGFSLYFSEVLHWIPCQLCIYQRMCIYPLAGLMLAHLFFRNRWIRRASYLFAGICPFISAYHIGIEIRGAESSFCSADVSCASVWFKSFGFLTIPAMALTASVTTLVLIYLSSRRETNKLGQITQDTLENSTL